MPVPHPFGLSLSGGGFRATAFHLGVLKRLRELRLLEEVDLLSTVSGGSIAGAYWVYWQTNKGDTLDKLSNDEWDRFERSLIEVLRRGIRGWVLWRGFGVPAVVLGALSGGLAWYLWPLSVWTLVGLALGPLVLAYIVWHYRVSIFLEKRYDQTLFNGSKVSDLKQLRMIINAAALNSGQLLLFSNLGQRQPGSHELIESLLRTKTLLRRRASVPMSLDIPLARAVAASSAIPGIFTPLTFKFNGLFGRLGIRVQRIFRLFQGFDPTPATYRVVDGGVFDNQGTQVLLDESCKAILVSDAAAALKRELRPSTWQLLPPGKGVVFRSQSIIYERTRDLGYKRLVDRHDLFCLLKDAVRHGLSKQVASELAQKYAPLPEGFAYVELRPSKNFKWEPHIGRLPEALVPYIAGVRTDLDRFSAIEISALMFHGYSVIDHCIRAYRPDWITNSSPALNFRPTIEDLFINWSTLSSGEVARIARHLDVSDSRIFIWRILRRYLNRCE